MEVIAWVWVQSHYTISRFVKRFLLTSSSIGRITDWVYSLNMLIKFMTMNNVSNYHDAVSWNWSRWNSECQNNKTVTISLMKIQLQYRCDSSNENIYECYSCNRKTRPADWEWELDYRSIVYILSIAGEWKDKNVLSEGSLFHVNFYTTK